MTTPQALLSGNSFAHMLKPQRSVKPIYKWNHGNIPIHACA